MRTEDIFEIQKSPREYHHSYPVRTGAWVVGGLVNEPRRDRLSVLEREVSSNPLTRSLQYGAMGGDRDPLACCMRKVQHEEIDANYVILIKQSTE